MIDVQSLRRELQQEKEEAHNTRKAEQKVKASLEQSNQKILNEVFTLNTRLTESVLLVSELRSKRERDQEVMLREASRLAQLEQTVVALERENKDLKALLQSHTAMQQQGQHYSEERRHFQQEIDLMRTQMHLLQERSQPLSPIGSIPSSPAPAPSPLRSSLVLEDSSPSLFLRDSEHTQRGTVEQRFQEELQREPEVEEEEEEEEEREPEESVEEKLIKQLEQERRKREELEAQLLSPPPRAVQVEQEAPNVTPQTISLVLDEEDDHDEFTTSSTLRKHLYRPVKVGYCRYCPKGTHTKGRTTPQTWSWPRSFVPSLQMVWSCFLPTSNVSQRECTSLVRGRSTSPSKATSQW